MKEILIIGEIEVEGREMPACKFIAEEPHDFSAASVAAMCVTLHNSFARVVEKDKQEEFSKAFKTVFDEIFNVRLDYSRTIENE